MIKSGWGLALVLAVLLLSSIGIIGLNLPDIYPELLNGMGASLSAILLALVIGTDLVFIVLIARTPNRQWEP